MPIHVLEFEKKLLMISSGHQPGKHMEYKQSKIVFFCGLHTNSLAEGAAKPRVENWPKEEHIQFCSVAGLEEKLLPAEKLSQKALTFPDSSSMKKHQKHCKNHLFFKSRSSSKLVGCSGFCISFLRRNVSNTSAEPLPSVILKISFL